MYKKNVKSVCFILTSLSYGGAQKQVLDLALDLKHRLWDVMVVSMIKPQIWLDELENSGLIVDSLAMRRGIPDPRALFKLAGLLRRFKPLVVHSHMVHANLLVRMVRLVTPMTILVCTAHNTIEGGRRREFYYRITDWLSDVTTNVSQAAVDRYIRVGAVPHSKIRFIPNGLDTRVFKPDSLSRELTRKELSLEDEFVWLAVGRLEKEKDHETLLQAFVKLTLEQNVLLLIAGEGSLTSELTARAKELGIDKYVRFLGIRKDIPRLMNAVDGYVMSSAWEGMPIVLLEAAATCLPIVATDVGGNSEVVKHGKTGYLVPMKNSQALADAMGRIMAAPTSERLRMGELGRISVERSYSLEHVVNMWEDLYQEFLSRSNNYLQ